MDDAVSIAKLQVAVEVIEKNHTVIFESLSKIKEKNNDAALNFQKLHHMIESLVKNGVKADSGMDEFKEDIRRDIKNLNSNVQDGFADSNRRLSRLEDKAFDSSKLMYGIYEISKNKFLWIFLTVAVLVYGREYSVDIVRELSALFKTAKVSK